MRELLTLKGSTDGSSTTGTFSLYSDMIYGSVSYVMIPKGLKAKVWCKRISGKAVEVIIQFTHDIYAGGSTPSPDTADWTEVGHEVLVSEGELILEKRRPLVLRGYTGKEAFRVRWSQSSAGLSYVEIEVELTDE